MPPKSLIPLKKSGGSDLKKILKAIRFAPSSLGLQAYHVFVITKQELKDKIQPIARNQEQVSSCSHLLVFCGRSDMTERIEAYLEATQKINTLPEEKINKRRRGLRASADKKSAEEKKLWAVHQAYLALGFSLAACAELRIDSCPMEGFDKKALDQLLKLPEYIQTVVLLPLGYRAEEPEFKKIRFAESDLFTWL